jgi:hypothetical protein
MKRNVKKQTLLLGEGIHQHTLYGDFTIEKNPTDFAELVVNKDSLLKHEHPNGSKGEHETLIVNKGKYVMGKQVEFNPFENRVTQIWD